ncbi:MAG: alpha/beta hydrolase [Acidimicrobiales bacterium]
MATATITTHDGLPLELEHEAFGRRSDPAVLLIMGTGTSMMGWDADLCRLVAQHGYRVIRYDHRDVGRSTKVATSGDPIDAVLSAFGTGDAAPPYSVRDLAADAVGLLDALDVHRAHVVGASLGGIVAQWLAIDHGDRVASLTVASSTTCEPGIGQPTAEAVGALLPAGTTLPEFVEAQVVLRRAIGGPRRRKPRPRPGAARDVAPRRGSPEPPPPGRPGARPGDLAPTSAGWRRRRSWSTAPPPTRWWT